MGRRTGGQRAGMGRRAGGQQLVSTYNHLKAAAVGY